MNHPVPGYLLPDVLIGTAAAVAVALVGLNRAVERTELPVRDRRRAYWSISLLFLAWLTAALVLSWSGFYQGSASRVPTLQYGLLIPILAGVVLFRRWATFRNTIRSIPQSWLVGIQTYRALGLT